MSDFGELSVLSRKMAHEYPEGRPLYIKQSTMKLARLVKKTRLRAPRGEVRENAKLSGLFRALPLTCAPQSWH